MPLLFPLSEQNPVAAETLAYLFPAYISAEIVDRISKAALVAADVVEATEDVALIAADVEGGSGSVVLIDLVESELR